MKSKHLAIIGSSAVALTLAVSIFFFNLATPETESQVEPIQISEPIEKVTERVELEHRDAVVPYDSTIRSGIIASGQKVYKTINLDHDAMFIFHGRVTVDFHGPSKIKSWVETPSGQISHESPLISSVLLKASNYDSNFLGVLLQDSRTISPDLSGRLVFADYGRMNEVEQSNLQNSVFLVEVKGEPAEDGSLVEIESTADAKGASALIVYSDDLGISFGQMKADYTYEPKIPVVSIAREDGMLLRQLAENNPTINLTSSSSAVSLTAPIYEFRTINLEIGTYKVWFHNEGPSDAEVVFDYYSHVERRDVVLVLELELK